MPANFRYAEIFRRGRPRHGKPGVLSTYDAFYIKHPPMSPLRRAKLFAPFDALAGFGGRIAAKEVLYKERKILTEEEKEELDRRLAVIHRLAPDTRTAQKNRLSIEVTYFSPCEDPVSESFGSGRGLPSFPLFHRKRAQISASQEESPAIVRRRRQAQ